MLGGMAYSFFSYLFVNFLLLQLILTYTHDNRAIVLISPYDGLPTRYNVPEPLITFLNTHPNVPLQLFYILKYFLQRAPKHSHLLNYLSMPRYDVLSGQARKDAFKTHLLRSLRNGRTPVKKKKTFKSLITRAPKKPDLCKSMKKMSIRKGPKRFQPKRIFDEIKTKKQIAIDLIHQHKDAIQRLTIAEIKRKKQKSIPKKKRKVQFLLPDEIDEETKKHNVQNLIQKYENGENPIDIAKQLSNL